MAFSLDSKVKDILKNPAAAAVLDKYSPDASRNPQMKLVGGLTLRKLASFPQSAFLKPHLEELDKDFEADKLISTIHPFKMGGFPDRRAAHFMSIFISLF